MVKWLIFGNFISVNQIFMNKISTLDHILSADKSAINHSKKVRNNFESQNTILRNLLDFASAVPDFRRLSKGNIRHSLRDIIMLIILARASRCVGRADIIKFGRENLNKFQKMGMLCNGVPSEPTLCRVENGINDLDMAKRMQEFTEVFHRQLFKIRIICAQALVNRKHALGT